MVTEEINLNATLESAGLDVVETDLGEYILQVDNMIRLPISWHQLFIRTKNKLEMFSKKSSPIRKLKSLKS